MRRNFGLSNANSLLPIATVQSLMEAPHIAEACEIELQRFRLDEPFARHVIDHKMRKIRLPGDGTKGCEFRCGEKRAT